MPGERPQPLPSFGVPPSRRPRPAATEPSLIGKRVILSTPEGFVYDMRAAGEVETDGSGHATIPIVTQHRWSSAAAAKRSAASTFWPAHLSSGRVTHFRGYSTCLDNRRTIAVGTW